MANPAKALWEYLKNAANEIGVEIKRQGAHGSAEIGNALYTGSAYTGTPPDADLTEKQKQQGQGQTQEQATTQERGAEQPKKERGGRKM